MPLGTPGPVIMSVVGDQFAYPVEIAAIIWDGATTAGDTVELREITSNNILFVGRAITTQTWEGIKHRMTAPGGFKLTAISSGCVLVYLAEAGQ